jgi:plastocyanin
MRIYRYLAVLCCLFVLSLLLTRFSVGKNIKNDVCSASNPASTAANTCGSASSPCSIDIKRSGSSYATAKPSIPDAKSNNVFYIKVGTKVTFMSSSNKTGFVVDFGESDPFDQGVILGGADRPITVTAKHPGCYTYTIGACTAGTVSGMCGNAVTQLIISAN